MPQDLEPIPFLEVEGQSIVVVSLGTFAAKMVIFKPTQLTRTVIREANPWISMDIRVTDGNGTFTSDRRWMIRDSHYSVGIDTLIVSVVIS